MCVKMQVFFLVLLIEIIEHLNIRVEVRVRIKIKV